MLKSLARLALISAALVFLSSVVTAQTPVRLTAQAAHSIDSLATTARTQRVETAACVVAYTATSLDSIGPANIAWADSVSVHPPLGETLCPFGVPWIHAHVAKNGVLDEPSETDRRTTRYVRAPFALILVVTDSARRLVIY